MSGTPEDVENIMPLVQDNEGRLYVKFSMWHLTWWQWTLVGFIVFGFFGAGIAAGFAGASWDESRKNSNDISDLQETTDQILEYLEVHLPEAIVPEARRSVEDDGNDEDLSEEENEADEDDAYFEAQKDYYEEKGLDKREPIVTEPAGVVIGWTYERIIEIQATLAMLEMMNDALNATMTAQHELILALVQSTTDDLNVSITAQHEEIFTKLCDVDAKMDELNETVTSNDEALLNKVCDVDEVVDSLNVTQLEIRAVQDVHSSSLDLANKVVHVAREELAIHNDFIAEEVARCGSCSEPPDFACPCFNAIDMINAEGCAYEADPDSTNTTEAFKWTVNLIGGSSAVASYDGSDNYCQRIDNTTDILVTEEAGTKCLNTLIGACSRYLECDAPDNTCFCGDTEPPSSGEIDQCSVSNEGIENWSTSLNWSNGDSQCAGNSCPTTTTPFACVDDVKNVALENLECQLTVLCGRSIQSRCLDQRGYVTI